MSLMILITETSCSFFFCPSPKAIGAIICEFQRQKVTPTRPILEVSPVFWLSCWSLLYSCIYFLSSPHWLGCWFRFLSASDWNCSSRRLLTQSCGLRYWPHAAIKAASLVCGCHQRQTRWPVSGGGFEEALEPVSCVLLPSPLHSTNYLPAPRRRALGLCLIVISCCCLSAAAEFYTGWLYAVWILLFCLSQLDLDDWRFCADTWVARLPPRITDLILPFLSTSHVHLLLCCVVKSILRSSASHILVWGESRPINMSF